MKRIITALSLGLALALTPVAAQATGDAHLEGHKRAVTQAHHHHCATAKRCRTAPLPVPIGGWPCAETKSCGQHHHYPICAPPVHVTPHPPVQTHKPRHHVKKHHHVQRHPSLVAVASHSPSLPRTGGLYEAGLIGSGSALGLGSLLLIGLALTKPERRWMKARAR